MSDVATCPKLPRVDGGNDVEDDVDLLGFAALESYELTQRETERGTSSGQVPVPRDSIPNPRVQAVQGSIPTHPIPVSHSITGMEKKQSGRVSETPVSRQGKSKGYHYSQPSASTHRQHGNSQLSAPASKLSLTQSGTTASTPSSGGVSLEEKVRELQEQNYSKVGEAKHLRLEKERLQDELRRSEEQRRQELMAQASERQAREKQLVRERDSLETKLKFKEQEMLALQERYINFTHQ